MHNKLLIAVTCGDWNIWRGKRVDRGEKRKLFYGSLNYFYNIVDTEKYVISFRENKEGEREGKIYE